MQRGYGILIAGVCMLAFGHFLSQWVVNSIPAINPSHSTMLSDAQYHMISWSNQLSIISETGIVVLAIGVFVAFMDRRKVKQNTG